MALTHRQEAFIEKYLECDNATQAYKYAYTTENMKDVTIFNSAYKIRHKPEVMAMLQVLKDKVNAKVIDKLVIDRTYITQEILDTIAATKRDKDHSNTLKGYSMLNNMYDLNEDKQNDRLVSTNNKLALVANYKRRLLDVTPEKEGGKDA